MPPSSKLPDDEIEKLRQWVERGAIDPRESKTQGSDPSGTDSDGANLAHGSKGGFDLKQRYQEHWSWREIAKPAIPNLKLGPDGPESSPIDSFIAEKLQDQGIRMADPASDEVWLRRVYFDLIGLPPTAEQIDRFRQDDAHSSHHRVVDDLLANPHFGEKWARHWMDLVRYAESYGHEFDYPINHAYRYRDYLIDAFNEDVPYDQFLTEHLAGDLIDKPRRDSEGRNQSIAGTAFWFLHEATHAPTDVTANEADIIDNQIDVFGKTFQGLTIACARCHDHKFDAISTADYYAMSAFLQSSCRQEYPSLRKVDRDRLAKIENGLKVLEETLEIDSTDEGEDDNLNVAFADFNGDRLPDGWSTSGEAFRVTGKTAQLRLDGKLSPAGIVDSGILGARRRGILRSPTFEITNDKIHIRMRSGPGNLARLVIDGYQLGPFHLLLFHGTQFDKQKIDTKGEFVWKSFGGTLSKYVGHRAYIEFVDSGGQEMAIDSIYLGEKPSLPSIEPVGLGDDCEFDPSSDPSLMELQQIERSVAAPTILIAMADNTPESALIFVRGRHTILGPKVPARYLTALSADQVPSTRQSNRLVLAGQLVSNENPLTARVIVNRLWHHLFGRGIVASVDDFGPQGIAPTHPKLLDHLADDLRRNRWSMKRAIREMVLSDVYVQSSLPHPQIDGAAIAESDPANDLLHRARIRRMTAEQLRDSMMAISGVLDRRIGGPSAIAFRGEYDGGRGKPKAGKLDGGQRRTLYLATKRNFLSPFLLTFDVPRPFGSMGRRYVSNVPAQGLAMMNDPMVRWCADAWKTDLQQHSFASQREMIAKMFVQATGEEPTDAMLDMMIKLEPSTKQSTEQPSSFLQHSLLNTKAFLYLR